MVLVVAVVVVCLSINLSIYQSIYLSIYLSICNAAILRDFLNLWTWQRQKRSNSARLPNFFKFHNIKNEAILRDVLQKWKVVCRDGGLVPMRFAIFPLHLSKVLLLPRKSDARSYEVLHLSRKVVSANMKIWGFKRNPSQEISALTS